MAEFEEVPYLMHGVDWGKTKVLARNAAGVMLVWISGGSVWNGLSASTNYCASELRILRTERLNGRIMGLILHEGGRLSKRLIAAHTERIDAELGAGAALRITLKGTVSL